jgi:hypothetical protein
MQTESHEATVAPIGIASQVQQSAKIVQSLSVVHSGLMPASFEAPAPPPPAPAVPALASTIG